MSRIVYIIIFVCLLVLLAFGLYKLFRYDSRKLKIAFIVFVLIASVLFYFWKRTETIAGTIMTAFPRSGHIEEYKVSNGDIFAKVQISYDDYQKIVSYYEGADILKGRYAEHSDFERILLQAYGDNLEAEQNMPTFDEYYRTMTIGATYGFLYLTATTGTADVLLAAQTDGDCYLYVAGSVLS